MASPPLTGPLLLAQVSNLTDLLPTDSIPPVRRIFPAVQSQSKPIYPSYHLEPTIPLPHRPRPSDAYKPLNILRCFPRAPILRLPARVAVQPAPIPKPAIDIVERRRPMEEFIAVVFGDEVWMGLVDFKSDKPRSLVEEEVPEEIGNPPRLVLDLDFLLSHGLYGELT